MDMGGSMINSSSRKAAAATGSHSSTTVIHLLLALSWSALLAPALASPWDNLPHKMSEGELMHHFDVEDPAQVAEGSYEVIRVTRRSVVTKRGGGPGEGHDAALEINAFDRKFDLKLNRNEHLVSDFLQIVETRGSGNETELNLDNSFRSCHYLIDHLSSGEGVHGAISDCSSEYRGYIFHGVETFDLTPLSQRLHDSVGIEDGPKDYHLIRRAGTLQRVSRM